MTDYQRTLPPQWIGSAIAFYAFIAIGIAEAGLGVLLPSILSTYNLTPATVTLLFLSQISGYILAAFTSSLVSSRLGLARMLLIAAGALTMALTIYAISPSWYLMVAAGSALGLGIGLIDAGINTYIVQDSRSASLIGLLHAFYGIGALSGPAIATTLLAVGMNWRQVYGVLAGIVSLFIVSVLGVIIFNYTPMTVRVLPSKTTALENLGRALQTPIVLLTGLLLLVYVGTEACIGNWAYTVQSVARHTPTLIAGYSVSAYWVGLTLGRFILGYFLQRLGAVRTISMSLSLVIIGLLAWWQLPDQLISLPLIGFGLAAIFPATIWLIPQRLPDPHVPAAVSIATSAASLGAAIVPTGAGWVASWTSLEIIPMLMLPLALLMVGLHCWLVQHSVTGK
ncbi:MFS transporter [Nostoc sp. 'Peltigera membranacea cyanobiont' 210A]|uniref:MFS transporter n=1 Tax=Nostoc sp. 'Peltigera membranacea cyanobiont' 210A TaxID=2014529 RepID=UPI000B954293|nr:MFS transporter [Nostoc sp. 'Peltigera membranacea cyanobiont' 210A]OYD91914.1 MFS transporter [Nostoc sp. 'Peltigera membranacea cyanobiont' 210A]